MASHVYARVPKPFRTPDRPGPIRRPQRARPRPPPPRAGLVLKRRRKRASYIRDPRHAVDTIRPPLDDPRLPMHASAAAQNNECGLTAADITNNAFQQPQAPCEPSYMRGARPEDAQALWRIPEYAGVPMGTAGTASRSETIAHVVPDLPSCAQQTPKQIIRNQGLYGIKGDWRCDRFQRSTFQDTRFVEPIGARNQFLAYNAYDQLHAKDQFLHPRSVAPAVLHRNPGPFAIPSTRASANALPASSAAGLPFERAACK